MRETLILSLDLTQIIALVQAGHFIMHVSKVSNTIPDLFANHNFECIT